jgi:hypothetical protein
MDFGEGLTRFTAWLAFAAWFAGLARIPRQVSPGHARRSAGIWLAGSLVMVLHTALAFQVHHDWSHAAAVIDTARQTRELTGLNWGGGVWLNYLFAFVWLGDAAWRRTQPEAHARRPRWLAVTTHAFLAFIWFNATVVFGSWPMRVVGSGVFVTLTVFCVPRLRRPNEP